MWYELRNRGGSPAQFLRPEDVKRRYQQPLISIGVERRRNLGEITRRTLFGRLNEADARIPPSQWTADLALKLVNRLNRVPSWRPEERYEGRRRGLRTGLHRER